MITGDVQLVEFYFDPGCPWTWKTARWLMATGFAVTWRPFRLEYLMDGEPVPEQWVAGAASSEVALRLVEHLGAQHRHDDIARFYRFLGERIHDRLEPQSRQLVRDVVATVHLDSEVAALSDESLDIGVRRAFDEAQELVGPGLGSPVLAITFATGEKRSLFGPIVTAELTPEDASRLWEATTTILRLDQVAELKRGRGLHHPLDDSLTPHVS